MRHFESRLSGPRTVGLLAVIPLCLVGALWGSERPPDWLAGVEATPPLRAAMAEAADVGATVPRSSVPRPPDSLRIPGAPTMLAAAVHPPEPSADATAPSEDGKEPHGASVIPLPLVLPGPRIDLSVSPDGGSPVPDGWALKEFTGRANVKVEKVGQFFAVHLNSDRASFGLHKDISVDVGQYPYLSWAWRVDQLPPKGDVRQKDTDDQAAQLYVVFPRFPAMVRSQIIGYVWDSTAPAGTVLTSPTNRMAKIIVLRSGADRLGQWVAESRNVLEDFRRLFGDPPPKAGKISLLINSQNTKSSAESWFASVVFTRNPLQRDTGMSADAMPLRAERDSGPGRPERVN